MLAVYHMHFSQLRLGIWLLKYPLCLSLYLLFQICALILKSLRTNFTLYHVKLPSTTLRHCRKFGDLHLMLNTFLLSLYLWDSYLVVKHVDRAIHFVAEHILWWEKKWVINEQNANVVIYKGITMIWYYIPLSSSWTNLFFVTKFT